MRALLVILLLQVLVQAAAPVLPGRLALTTFQSRDGAPDGAVELLHRDPQGDLWVGTQEGLYRYDGTRWSPMPLPQVPRGRAWIFSAASQGPDRLWVGTNGSGLFVREGGTWSVVPGPFRHVTSLLVTETPGAEPTLWIGSQDHGLWRRQGSRLEPVPGPPGGPLPPVNTLLAEPGSPGPSLLVGTYRGLYRLSGSTWTTLGPGETRIMSLAWDPQEPRLWVGTRQGLLSHQAGRWQGPERGLPSDHVYTLAQGPCPGGGETLWAGTAGGLVYRDGSVWRPLPASSGLPATYIRSLVATGELGGLRQLWVGTLSGLARIAPHLWRSIDADLGLGEDQVYAVTDDPAGGHWFGHVTQGIARLHRGTWTVQRQLAGRPMPAVFAFATVRSRVGSAQVFAGTRGLGVLAWNGTAWYALPWNPRLPDPSVYAFATHPDRPGLLWVGTDRGLARVQDGRLEAYTSNQGVPDSRVECLALRALPGGGEELWVGTRSQGLWRFLSGRWQRMDSTPAFEHVGALWVDADGHHLWGGSPEKGVFRLDTARPDQPWLLPDAHNGLPDVGIRGLRQDRNGALWLFSSEGVFRWSPEPRLRRSYTEADGLPTRGCSAGAHHQDSEGRLWVGTARGAAWLDPELEPPWPLPQPPRLAEAATLPGRLPILPGASLSHRERGLHIHLAPEVLHREADHRYRFQVEGLEPQPADWSTSPLRELVALPPGRYALLAWIRDPSGRVSLPLRLPFQVRPAPWAHPAAFLLYAVLIIGAGWQVARWRTRLLEARSRDLARQVAVATEELRHTNLDLAAVNAQQKQLLHLMAHDLRNPLSTVSLSALALEEDPSPEGVVEGARRIRVATDGMADLIARILHLEALEAGQVAFAREPFDLGELLEAVGQEFQPTAQRKGQRLEVTASALPLAVGDPTFSREVIRNLVSNAVKYTPLGGAIAVRGVATDDGVGFEVVDDGPGIPTDEQDRLFCKFTRLSPRPTQGESSAGVGLANARLVVEAMGGRIQYAPGPGGRGACFSVRLPRWRD